MNPICSHPDGVTVRVLVVPGASRTEIKGRHGDSIRVRVAAPAEGGKANRVVLSMLSDAVGGTATLLRGATSRNKIVLIRDVDADAVSRALDT